MYNNRSRLYKNRYTFEERKADVDRMLSPCPMLVAVILEKMPSCQMAELQRIKYLLPGSLKLHDFKYKIQKKLRIRTGLYFFINGVNQNSSDTMEDLYKNYHEEDGWLYMQYSNHKANVAIRVRNKEQ